MFLWPSGLAPPSVSDTNAVSRITYAHTGFLPVLYTTLSARWRAPSVQLPEESSSDALDDLSESQKLPLEKLTGWRILLFWLPALCDLTGTTVRTSSTPLHCATQGTHLCATGLYSS
jgi:hypothetical protein